MNRKRNDDRLTESRVELTHEEIKNIEYDILCDVDEFCRKNEITYFLAYGTLIGAVRHQGFIPWDDDIDIFVPRPDYDRFIQSYKPTDPSKQYRVIDGSDKRCKTVYAKVYDATTIKIESGCDYTSIQPIGVDIDVLPIDGLPEDEREYCSHRKKIKMLNRLFTLCVKEPRKSVVRYIASEIARMFGQAFWVRLITALATKYPYDRSKKAGMIVTIFEGYDDRYPISIFRESIPMRFESRDFPIPIGYHECLTQLYGDYMKQPDLENRRTHHKNKCYRMVEL